MHLGSSLYSLLRNTAVVRLIVVEAVWASAWLPLVVSPQTTKKIRAAYPIVKLGHGQVLRQGEQG